MLHLWGMHAPYKFCWPWWALILCYAPPGLWVPPGMVETDFRVLKGSSMYHGLEYQNVFPLSLSKQHRLGSLKSSQALFCFFPDLCGVI